MPKKKQTKKKPTPKKRKYARTGKILTKTIYAYVEPANQKHAIASGKKPKFGTTSAYINALIAADRGVKAAKGTKGQQLPKSGRQSSSKSKTSAVSKPKKSLKKLLRKRSEKTSVSHPAPKASETQVSQAAA